MLRLSIAMPVLPVTQCFSKDQTRMSPDLHDITSLQAAAPVGKWVVQQSFKAALGVLSSDGAKRRQNK